MDYDTLQFPTGTVLVPCDLPILPLERAPLPGTVVPVDVRRPESTRLVRHSLARCKSILAIGQLRGPIRETVRLEDLYPVGCAAVVVAHERRKREMEIVIKALCRVRIEDLWPKPFRVRLGDRLRPRTAFLHALISLLPDQQVQEPQLARQLETASAATITNAMLQEWVRELGPTSDLGVLTDLIGCWAELEPAQQSVLLETTNVHLRAQRLIDMLTARQGYR